MISPRKILGLALVAGLILGPAGSKTSGARPVEIRPAPASQIAETRRSEILSPGIEYLEIKRGDFTSPEGNDRWTIHVLVLDPSRVRIETAIAMDEIAGAETTSSISARRGALAAVNGGYFRTTGTVRGEPMGLLVAGGRYLSEPNPGRSVLALTNEGSRTRFAFARVDFKAEIMIDGAATRILDGINRPRDANEVILFTPEFHRTTLTAPDGLEAVIRAGRIIDIFDGRGSASIPADGSILSFAGTARDGRSGLFAQVSGSISEPTFQAKPPFPFSSRIYPRRRAASPGRGPADPRRSRNLSAGILYDPPSKDGPRYPGRRDDRPRRSRRPSA